MLHAGTFVAGRALAAVSDIRNPAVLLQSSKSLEEVLPDPQLSAMEAQLHYVSDAEPGIRRISRGPQRFGYRTARGERVEDGETLARIRKLAIPPAWTDVWISPDPEGHLQATGRDQRGRKQYRYHERWSAVRDEAKYSSLVAFGEALPALRRHIDAELRNPSLTRESVIASVIWLLDHTMIRVGNATYARDNQSFGLTTLRQRHAVVKGARIRFAFKGKSGKQWKLELVDRRIVRVVRQAQDLPGQQLFQYLDEDGEPRPLSSQDVNDYLREMTGADFSSKHFRTWGGTRTAAALFSGVPLPDSQRDRKIALNRVIDQVAAQLGNTRAVCRKCYVHPTVIESWLTGTLADEMAAARKSFRKPIEGLDEEETLVLKWLKARAAA
jgi:DNA topoisomerase I